MNRDDIIRMAIDCATQLDWNVLSDPNEYTFSPDALEKFSALVAAAEREARALEAKKVAWPEGYEIHELPADYTGPVWIEGQVRRLFDYVNREECMNEDIPKSAADNTEQMLIDAMRSTMAVAWGYLWHITTNDMRVNGARKMLLDMIQASGISNEEFFEMKRYGLKEAKKDGCLVNIHEIESSALWGEE